MRVAAILSREQRLVAGQRNQRGKMRAGRVAHQPDAIGIDAESRGVGASELNGGFDIIDRRGKRLGAGLRQPVADRKDCEAMLGEESSPMPVGDGAADLPSAAVHGNHQWRLVEAFRQIEIARQGDPVMLRIFDLGLRRDRVGRWRGLRLGSRRHRCERECCQQGLHGRPPPQSCPSGRALYGSEAFILRGGLSTAVRRRMTGLPPAH